MEKTYAKWKKTFSPSKVFYIFVGKWKKTYFHLLESGKTNAKWKKILCFHVAPGGSYRVALLLNTVVTAMGDGRVCDVLFGREQPSLSAAQVFTE